MGFATRKLAALVKLVSSKNIAEERSHLCCPASCTTPVQPTQASACSKTHSWKLQAFSGCLGWDLLLSLNSPGRAPRREKAVQTLGQGQGQ